MTEIDPAGEISLPPTTTLQEDLTHEGQRRVNLIWERTQSGIALTVVVCTLITDGMIALSGIMVTGFEVSANQLTGVTHINVMCSLVIGFYFSRTNHQAIGGVGRRPVQSEYTGR